MQRHQFTKVEFHRFKAFESFTLHIRPFNILVGPNNAGKSTILAAFRILAAALRRAGARRPELISGPLGKTRGYPIDIANASVAEENIFYNYDDDEPAFVRFTLSNGNELFLFFPERGTCNLIARPAHGRALDTPSSFKNQFNCKIGFVPILGPVEHNEPLFGDEAARRALFSYQAARNFRNIWYHFPQKFDEFQAAIRTTWPGMDVSRPEADPSHDRTLLRMFCPEGRMPREIFWAGFGFQVWCQMLTHLIQSGDASIFLIDEPDIYLHSDLQRQLIGLLRNLGPDILIATHSTEMVTEAEPEEIVQINKHHRIARRIKHASQLPDVFGSLGSSVNPILTQLAKTRRAVFVEGKDFQIIGRFASKLGIASVASRSGFAIVPSEGFNPERVKNIKEGMEVTLGSRIRAMIVFDRDYRCSDEASSIKEDCTKFCDVMVIHERKEIENFLLVPSAIDRAISRKIVDKARRAGSSAQPVTCAKEILDTFAAERKGKVVSQYLAKRRRFMKASFPNLDDATITERGLAEIEARWNNVEDRFAMLPGKEALSALNQIVQDKYNVSVSPTAIIDAMTADEIPEEMKQLLKLLSDFASAGKK